MIRPEFKNELLGQQKRLRRIWFLLAEAMLLFLGMPYLLSILVDREYPYGEAVRLGTWVLAIAQLGVLAWWKKTYLAPRDVLWMAASNRKLRRLRGISPPRSPFEDGAAKAVSWFWNAKLVALGYAESLSVYGFIVAFFSGYFLDQVVLSLIGGLLLAREFPAAEGFEKVIEEYEAGGL